MQACSTLDTTRLNGTSTQHSFPGLLCNLDQTVLLQMRSIDNFLQSRRLVLTDDAAKRSVCFEQDVAVGFVVVDMKWNEAVSRYLSNINAVLDTKQYRVAGIREFLGGVVVRLELSPKTIDLLNKEWFITEIPTDAEIPPPDKTSAKKIDQVMGNSQAPKDFPGKANFEEDESDKTEEVEILSENDYPLTEGANN